MKITKPKFTVDLNVRGQVQGVNFRSAVAALARRLNLKGSVRNNPDGTVTIVAQGQADRLHSFIAALYSVESPAIVNRVEEHWLDTSISYPNFSIQ